MLEMFNILLCLALIIFSDANVLLRGMAMEEFNKQFSIST